MKDRIIKYINEEETDYAIMIAGEWGVGKTYYIKNSLKKELENESKRMVYVSLIGIDSDEKLEWKIYSQINPFYKSKKSEIAIEAEHMEQLVTKENKQKLIPKNVVLVMDDLERINPDYLEAAMGYLNVFIEHDNAKCIFVCNESVAVQLKSYKVIKEKYIRYTYLHEERFAETAKSIILDRHEEIRWIDEIIRIFEKGQHLNLRTLLYALSMYDEVLEKLEEKRIDYKDKRDMVLHYILSYICFYSIEKKKGGEFSILSKVTTQRYDPSLWELDLGEPSEEDVVLDEIKQPKEKKIVEKNEDRQISIIQELYFRGKPITFYYFGSIARFIVYDTLDISELINEINDLVENLRDAEQQNRKDQISNMLSLNNDKYIDTIKELIETVKEGSLNLRLISNLYSNLVFLNKQNLKGIDTEELLKSIANNADKALRNPKVKYNQQVNDELNYDLYNFKEKEENEHAAFIEKLININQELKNRDYKDLNMNLVLSISKKDTKQIETTLIKDDNLYLSPDIANELLAALKRADTDVVKSFSDSLYHRYSEKDDTWSYTRKRRDELEFITKLHTLLNEDQDLKPEEEKDMSEIQLVLLKRDLGNIIKAINDEDKKNM